MHDPVQVLYYECVYKLFKKLAMGIALFKKVIYSPTPETVTAEFCIIFQSIGPTCTRIFTGKKRIRGLYTSWSQEYNLGTG